MRVGAIFEDPWVFKRGVYDANIRPDNRLFLPAVA